MPASSKCCLAPVTMKRDFTGTYPVCQSCGKPCSTTEVRDAH